MLHDQHDVTLNFIFTGFHGLLVVKHCSKSIPESNPPVLLLELLPSNEGFFVIGGVIDSFSEADSSCERLPLS